MARQKESPADRLTRLSKERKVKVKAQKAALKKERDRLSQWAKRLQVKDNKQKDWNANEEQLKDRFFEAMVQSGGHRGLALKMIGTDRIWFKKMVATDKDFGQQVIDCMEDAEDTLQAVLFTNAMQGNPSAAREYFRRTEILKAKLLFEQRIIQVQQAEVSLDKIVALKFAVKELMVSYLEFKASGRDTHALQALKQYIELLELTDVSGVGEYEILTGTSLIEIVESLGIGPKDVEDISFEEIEDEHIKQHYVNMFPQIKTLSDGKVEK